MDDAAWTAVGKAIDLLKLLVIVGLIAAVGYGILNADGVLKVFGQAVEMLKAAR